MEASSLNVELATFRTENLPPEVLEVIANSIVVGSRGSVRGLPIGARAPDAKLLNQKAKEVSLYAKLSEGPVVLCFFRGEWCPFCMMEIRALAKVAAQIRAASASLVFVHPQQHSVSERISRDYRAPFEICADALQAVMAAFEVKFSVTQSIIDLYRNTFGLDLNQLNANGEWNLPVPATFVIDRDGIIKGRQFSHDFMVRVEPSYVLEVLGRLPALSPEFIAPSSFLS
jgi:peroxiredoxin